MSLGFCVKRYFKQFAALPTTARLDFRAGGGGEGEEKENPDR